MIEQFNAHQRRRGLLESTIYRRGENLRRFDRWLDPGSLADATVADLQAFLEARSWEDSTRYVFISHLHSFYKWAVREGVAELDPTEYIDRPRLRPGLPRPIPDDALAYLVSQATGRMHSWLLLGALQGLRCMEMAGLERSDVIDADHYLRVMGKGRKERIVPLHPLVLESLRRLPMPRVGPLFRNARGRPISADGVQNHLNTWMHAMGVSDTAHQLRHWFGTRSYQACQDVLAVAGLMGHSNTASTAVYAQFSQRVATAAVLSLSPGPRREDDVLR